MKRIPVLSLLTLSLLTLNACQGGLKDFKMPSFGQASKDKAETVATVPCPAASVMPELGSLTQLRGGNILSATTIQHISVTCQSTPTLATARIKIDFQGMLGPEGIKDAKVEANYSLPYLIAVIDPAGKILSKDIFAISMIYRAGQPAQMITDLLEQTIPLKPGQNAADYKIAVGFQLSEEDLTYNRAHIAN